MHTYFIFKKFFGHGMDTPPLLQHLSLKKLYSLYKLIVHMVPMPLAGQWLPVSIPGDGLDGSSSGFFTDGKVCDAKLDLVTPFSKIYKVV